MTNSHILALGLLFLALLYPGSNALSIKLSALRPDLDFLRETWLQNPEKVDVPGRIIFSNSSEIVVKFEHLTNAIGGVGLCPDVNVDAWKNDSLQLQNIDTPVEELFYKHGTFYIRRYQCDLPEVLLEGSWVEMLPIKPENNQEALEIRYTSLETLAKEIERETSRIDTEKTGMEGLILKSTKTSSVTVSLGNKLSFEYNKGELYVDMFQVRTIQPPSRNDDASRALMSLYKTPEKSADFTVTEDCKFIRYHRNHKLFNSEKDAVDVGWMVRSNVGYSV